MPARSLARLPWTSRSSHARRNSTHDSDDGDARRMAEEQRYGRGFRAPSLCRSSAGLSTAPTYHGLPGLLPPSLHGQHCLIGRARTAMARVRGIASYARRSCAAQPGAGVPGRRRAVTRDAFGATAHHGRRLAIRAVVWHARRQARSSDRRGRRAERALLSASNTRPTRSFSTTPPSCLKPARMGPWNIGRPIARAFRRAVS